MPTYTEMVRKAVKDPYWQKYRAKLKGEPTERKLDMLRSYWALNCSGVHNNGLCTWCLQVDSYIKGMCRGGQLKAGESLHTVQQANWYQPVTK